VQALVVAGLVDLDRISERIDLLPDTVAAEVRAGAQRIVEHLR